MPYFKAGKIPARQTGMIRALKVWRIHCIRVIIINPINHAKHAQKVLKRCTHMCKCMYFIGFGHGCFKTALERHPMH